MKSFTLQSKSGRPYQIIFSIFLSVASLFFLPSASAEVINIDNVELAHLMSKGVPLIDIRNSDEWKNTGIIANSQLITFFDEQGRVNVPQWLALTKPFAGPDQPTILICHSGGRSQQAAKFLSETIGYKTVYNVKHGLMGWLEEHRPVIPAEKP